MVRAAHTLDQRVWINRPIPFYKRLEQVHPTKPTKVPNHCFLPSDHLSSSIMGAASSKFPGVERSLTLKRAEVPKFVVKELGVNEVDVAQLEVTCSSSPLYDALTKYFAQRGVDLDVEPPFAKDRIHTDPLKDEREYPGKLTSYQNPPSKFGDRFRWFAKSEKEEQEVAQRVTYAVGYGWGKIRTNPSEENPTAGNQTVLFHHYARGEPIEENFVMSVLRTVVLYAKNDAVIKALNREALGWYRTREQLVLAAQGGKYVLYTLKLSSWICHGHRRSRPCSSIVLAPGVQEAMLADARSFFDKQTKDWYYSHGVPYRRSYLLYGPPGTGKTSQIRALAGEQRLKACFMSMSHKYFGDHTLIEAMARIPKPSVLVFEDIDALFDKRKNRSESTLTFSGLLNAVDGIVSTEGTLIMMTTNHIDRLDPALLRCGRIDRRFEFSLPGHNEVARYYRTFYPDAPMEYSTRFADLVFEREEKMARSLATLQQHFIYCRGESAETALDKVDEFFRAYFPDSGAEVGSDVTASNEGDEKEAEKEAESPSEKGNGTSKESDDKKISESA